jgi:hypothetical protein
MWRLRRFRDPAKKAASLAKLKEWKEAHKKSKEEKYGWLEITII